MNVKAEVLSCTDCGEQVVRTSNCQIRCSACRPTANAAIKRAHYERTRHLTSAKDRRRHLLEQYGLSPEMYDEMLAAQGGTCALCHTPERAVTRIGGRIRNLNVDHDHRTGKVRGLLCVKCNLRRVGVFEAALSDKALIAYLVEHGSRVAP